MAGAPSGSVVWADSQVAGRGQHGRSFASPLGGLYFSLILRPTLVPERLPLITLITGLVVWGMLVLLDVRFAFMWGLLAFALNYIPNIGSVLAAIPPILQVLVFGGLYEALVVLAGYLIVNLVFGNILEPRIMGRGLGLSTLVVFLSLIFWGWLLGPVGMLLSVPLTIIVKIALEQTSGDRKSVV